MNDKMCYPRSSGATASSISESTEDSKIFPDQNQLKRQFCHSRSTDQEDEKFVALKKFSYTAPQQPNS